ncbi:MAG: LysR family transcriptional regulator [Rhodospirillaceae bacterium]
MRHLRILEYVDRVARTGSIRGAAEQLNFTASALTRRIFDLEAELGAKLFERTPRGMRLTAAGELFVAHARAQLAEVERLKSGIEDLRGLRRGLVRIACSQAMAPDFLPRTIGEFRRRCPQIAFDVRVTDHETAMDALVSYEVDIVLVFQPAPHPQFQQLARLEQRLVAQMARDHPLAGQATAGQATAGQATAGQAPLRLRDCASYPVALSDRSTGGRQLLDRFSARTGVQFEVAVESNSFELLRRSVVHSGLVSFQIEVGAPPETEGSDIVVRRIDRRDTPPGALVLGQLRGRGLPVACAMFAEHLSAEMTRAGTARDPGATAD